MGKKEKEHRKKVEVRNQKINAQKNAMQKIFDESMKKQLEDLKKQYDAAKSGPQASFSAAAPQTASEMMLTANEDIIKSMPSDDDMTDLDYTLISGLDDAKNENENIESIT